MATMFGDSELWNPATRRDPHAFYARVREAGRPVPQIDPAGDRFWVVASHADVLYATQRSGTRSTATGPAYHRQATP